MTAPQLSLVVPTIGRPASLRRLLGSLVAQTAPPAFDVVVVGDRVAAPAVGVGDSRGWPFDIRVVTSGGCGAAAARNTGVRESTGRTLLFLDDDVELEEGALAAHAAFHAGGTERIGAGGLSPVPEVGGFVGAALAGWWEQMDDRLSDPNHRFTFRDVLTGHCSMPRRTFERVGGFDDTLACHEDFDFGYRALLNGVPIRRVPGAGARHHDGSTLAKILARKRDEGRAGVQLVARHPALIDALPLGQPLAAGRLARLAHRAAMSDRGLAALVPLGGASALRLCELLGLRDKWRLTLDRLMDYAYWHGVRAEAGSDAVDLRPTARARPVERAPALEIDLAQGLERAERLLDEARPSSLGVRLHGLRVGSVPAAVGTEPLRGRHLRPLLLGPLLPGLLRAAADTGMMPDVLAAHVRAGGTAGAGPEEASTGEAA